MSFSDLNKIKLSREQCMAESVSFGIENVVGSSAFSEGLLFKSSEFPCF